MNLRACYFLLTKIDSHSIQRLARVFRKFLHLLLLVLIKIFLSQNYLFGSSGSGSNGTKVETVKREGSAGAYNMDWIHSPNAGACSYDFHNVTESEDKEMRVKYVNSNSGANRTFFLKIEENCNAGVVEA